MMEVVDSIRIVATKIRRAIGRGQCSRYFDANDLVEALYAVADELNKIVASQERAANGRMDAWGFWNRALSDAELDAIRNGGRGVEYRHLTAAQRTGLIAFYDLGEASGVRADYSGNGQHLTPVGGPANADGLVT